MVDEYNFKNSCYVPDLLLEHIKTDEIERFKIKDVALTKLIKRKYPLLRFINDGYGIRNKASSNMIRDYINSRS